MCMHESQGFKIHAAKSDKPQKEIENILKYS